MSIAPAEPEDDNPEREADRQAEAMKTQLRKDVDSWSKARNEATPGRVAEAKQPVARPASRQPAAAKSKSSSAPVAAKPAATRSKPFSMSYDGQTIKDYVEHMISRGAR